MVTVTFHVNSKLSDVEMVRLLSNRAPGVCNKFAEVIEDVVTAGLRDWDSCEVVCEMVEVFATTLRKV